MTKFIIFILNAPWPRSRIPINSTQYWLRSTRIYVSRRLSKAYTTLRRRIYSGADKYLARPTSRCILFDGENISFDASLVMYVYK